MSELVDKQVNVQKESLKKLPGFMQNSRKPTKKCVMKMKETNKQTKKNRRAPKIFFDGRKEFIRRVRKTRVMDIKRLQVNDSSYIVFSKRVNRCQGDGFSSVGTRTGTIKLTMAAT